MRDFGRSSKRGIMEGSRLLCLLLAFSALLCVVLAAETPFMVVHKKVSVSKWKPDVERVTVSINLYNRGSTTAYDVSLIDDSWPSDTFSLVSGNTSFTWDKLDVGASVSHTFVLESKVKGLFYGRPALVKYRVAAKSVLQEAHSTPIPPLDILAERAPEKKYEWAKKLAAKYGPVTSVLTIVGGFIYLLVSPSKPGNSKSSKKRR